MPDETHYWAALASAIEIVDLLGPWPPLKRAIAIGQVTYLLLDRFKRQGMAAGLPLRVDDPD